MRNVIAQEPQIIVVADIKGSNRIAGDIKTDKGCVIADI